MPIYTGLGKFKETLNLDQIPETLLQIVCNDPSDAPKNDNLVSAFNSFIARKRSLEALFNPPLTYQKDNLQSVNLESVLQKTKKLIERIAELQVWIDFKEIYSALSNNGLQDFLDKLLKNPIPAYQLFVTFDKSFFQEWVNKIYDEDENLKQFRRENHEQLIEEFKRLDRELIRLSPNKVKTTVNLRKPQGIWLRARDSETSIIAREASKKRKHMPIRNLLQRIPNILQVIKPCILMSPISVSQFLTPELTKFDLVLFDEASQIVPEDAIGAIYRGKCVVIAGDSKQLPPTSFFERITTEDDQWEEDEAEDIECYESILDISKGIGLPENTLKWHYRSKHEDLIAFSNHRFYEDKLITFPSAVANDETLGVKLVYVENGVYYRGTKRDNPREAEVVSNLVIEHLTKYPQKTLGIVTFSVAQKEI